MGFLAGRMTFERFRIEATGPRNFGPDDMQILEQYAIGQAPAPSEGAPESGFLAGEHLFDLDFDLEKNVINEALHAALRIDTHKIPAALRKAWLQIELAAAAAENPSGRPTKAQREQAKDAVEARCEEELKSGKFRRMQQFPVLWDGRDGILYSGGTSPALSELCTGLFSQAFDLSMSRLTPTLLAEEWASDSRRKKALADLEPSSFLAQDPRTDIAWMNPQSGNADFLGNEFLLWLWWTLETQTDTIPLADGSEVAAMFTGTLSLECPHGESGKETISAESPVRLPEARQAIRSGKLPRKAGLTLVRHGEQYEFVLQAETFAVSGAKVIPADEQARGRAAAEERIDSLRQFGETITLLFEAFCERRIDQRWEGELEQIQRWLQMETKATKKPAA